MYGVFFLAAHAAKDHDIEEICYHNGREGISRDDVIEHIGNGEYGSAWRDAKDSDTGQQVMNEVTETAVYVLDTIGNETLRGQDE